MGLPGHEELINAVKFTPNGRLIASASDDRTVSSNVEAVHMKANEVRY